jgi:pimeloyl-ACP methyl ester carboxylesterase
MTIDSFRFVNVLKSIVKWILYIAATFLILVVAVLLFFRLFTAIREAKTPSEIAPLSGKFVKAGDAMLYLQETGPATGQAVVLIHGTGAWSELWRDTILPLTEAGFRVVALDLPPFGFSEKLEGAGSYTRQKQAARIIGVLDALNIQKAILVGHSVGGRPTLEVALAYPNRITKLILVDPALGFASESSPVFLQNNPSFVVSGFFKFKSLRNAALATYGTNPMSIKGLFSSFVFNKHSVTADRVATLKKPLVLKNMTQGEGDWLEYLLVSEDNSLGSDSENLKNLKMPVYIIWGDKDTVTPLWQGKELQKLVPGSKLEIVEGAGHIPYIEDAERFNGLLLQFLQEKNDYK